MDTKPITLPCSLARAGNKERKAAKSSAKRSGGSHGYDTSEQSVRYFHLFVFPPFSFSFSFNLLSMTFDLSEGFHVFLKLCTV